MQNISNETLQKFSFSVQQVLASLSPEKQQQFQMAFLPRAKDPNLMLVLAIIFPIHFFLLDEPLLGALYWLTSGGCMVWYIIEIFMVKSRVQAYHDKIASEIINVMR